MKKKNEENTIDTLEQELHETKNKLAQIQSELASTNDFILSYLKILAITHGNRVHLDELKERYGWKMPKVLALSAAINHFCARGLLKRGSDSKEVFVDAP